MATDKKQKLSVITNEKLVQEIQEKQSKNSSFQTNPLREKLIKHVNEDSEKKFSVKDILKW